MYVDPTGLWNEESRWYKPWTWLNAPNSEENTLGQLALDIQWQMINSGDSSRYIASFQGATGIKETGRINDETAELLDTYGQWYLMNNNLTLSNYMLAKWKQTDEQLFWRLTNTEYQRLKLIDDLYTIYSIYSLASLGFDAYKEIAVARQMHLQPRVNLDPSGQILSTGKNNQYSTLYEANTGSGSSRGAHRIAANKQFYNELASSRQFKNTIDSFFGYDVMEYMKSGKSPLINPSSGWVWHHPVDAAGKVRLIPKIQHQDSALQFLLHPGPKGEGGFKLFY